jgi:hypothetical protein
MTRPNFIICGGHPISVSIGAKDEYMEAKNLIGEFDPIKQEINIKSGMGPGITDQVIVHELLHALFYTGQCHGIGLIDTELEEKLITALENPLYRFLMDNDLSWLRRQGPQGK